jgi:hypothetical protein
MVPSNNGLVLVTGGVELQVKFQDENLPSEIVKVRQLPIRHMDKYLACFDDEAKAIELFCDKPEGWADSLTPASHNELIEKGQELNFPLFDGWYRRRMARAEMLSPGLTERLKEIVGNVALKAVEAGGPSKNFASPSPLEPVSP